MALVEERVAGKMAEVVGQVAGKLGGVGEQAGIVAGERAGIEAGGQADGSEAEEPVGTAAEVPGGNEAEVPGDSEAEELAEELVDSEAGERVGTVAGAPVGSDAEEQAGIEVGAQVVAQKLAERWVAGRSIRIPERSSVAAVGEDAPVAAAAAQGPTGSGTLARGAPAAAGGTGPPLLLQLSAIQISPETRYYHLSIGVTHFTSMQINMAIC